ncbi:hypothetical protein BZG36_05213 [Bifiguratus adelaidae]|uniref:Uncharacterized protein n=1 Tax=Bifiguratus adelaidae TaxID=1938954 RepID=A0A261XUR8_9FUNG|nr:hypothetical protein BZG36_05213 [Bifiguratus adelaidae]
MLPHSQTRYALTTPDNGRKARLPLSPTDAYPTQLDLKALRDHETPSRKRATRSADLSPRVAEAGVKRRALKSHSNPDRTAYKENSPLDVGSIKPRLTRAASGDTFLGKRLRSNQYTKASITPVKTFGEDSKSTSRRTPLADITSEVIPSDVDHLPQNLPMTPTRSTRRNANSTSTHWKVYADEYSDVESAADSTHARTEGSLSPSSRSQKTYYDVHDDVEHSLPPNETPAYREAKRKSLESSSKLNRTESNASSDIGSPSLRPQGRKRQVLGEIPVHTLPEYAEYFVNGSVTPNARAFELHYTEETWEEAVEVFRHSQATESLPSVLDFFSEDVRSYGQTEGFDDDDDDDDDEVKVEEREDSNPFTISEEEEEASGTPSSTVATAGSSTPLLSPSLLATEKASFQFKTPRHRSPSKSSQQHEHIRHNHHDYLHCDHPTTTPGGLQRQVTDVIVKTITEEEIDEFFASESDASDEHEIHDENADPKSLDDTQQEQDE